MLTASNRWWILGPAALAIGALAASSACGCAGDGRRSRAETTPDPVSRTAAGAAVAEAESSAPATALSAEMATRYFRSGPAAAAARAFELEQWERAEKGFEQVLKQASGSRRSRARLMLGLSQLAQKKWTTGAEHLEAALEELPLLGDYIRYQIARAWYFAGQRSRALEHARAVSSSSIAGADAELLTGDILRADGAWAEVADHYARYRKERPNGIRRSEARYRQAEAILELVRSSRREASAAEEALTLLRKNTVADPLSPWAERSQKLLDAVLKNPPSGLSAAARKRARAPLSAGELIERGMEYYHAMRNEKSEADFAAALKKPGLSADTRCVAAYHRARSVYKQRERKRAAPLFDEALAACLKTDNTDLRVKSAYLAGRSYANFREREKAIERYRKIEELHPDHSYADDARLRQAEEHHDLKNDDKVVELLSSIPEVYPQGDMRAEAMWRLAWRAIKADDHRQAIKWLKRQIEVKPIDDNYWAEGQAQYWLGRAHAELGETRASIEAYRSAIDQYPMSYYALLALNRLREKHPEVFQDVFRRIRPAARDAARHMVFRARPDYQSEGFRRALEFLRLGLGNRAEAELRRLGFTSPPNRDPVTDPDQRDRIWAMAYLFDRAQRYVHSHWPTRWHVLDYKRHWPNAEWRAHWDIAYPRAWWNLVEKYASKHGYPPELQLAIVREESAFDPLRESYANAIGLTQMIFPTARRFAKGTGIAVSRETLRDPENNVTIGSNFLGFLMDKFEDRVALVVPSYNAGEGATSRWLRERGDWPQDEWSEEIPYDQARRYSKRVIATYFAYSFLKDGTIPVMPNDIPKSVLP